MFLDDYFLRICLSFLLINLMKIKYHLFYLISIFSVRLVFSLFPFFPFFSRGGLIPNFGDGRSGFGDQKCLSTRKCLVVMDCGFQMKSTITTKKYPFKCAWFSHFFVCGSRPESPLRGFSPGPLSLISAEAINKWYESKIAIISLSLEVIATMV